MKFYKDQAGDLFSFNNDVLIKKNVIVKQPVIPVTKELLPTLHEIKRDEFSRLMNVWFKATTHEWEYNGEKFKKLPNIESNSRYFCTNYQDVDFGPYPTPVYHWGRIYLFTWSYNGYPQGQLIDIRTGKYVRWAKSKHCAPIFNVTRNKIVTLNDFPELKIKYLEE